MTQAHQPPNWQLSVEAAWKQRLSPAALRAEAPRARAAIQYQSASTRKSARALLSVAGCQAALIIGCKLQRPNSDSRTGLGQVSGSLAECGGHQT